MSVLKEANQVSCLSSCECFVNPFKLACLCSVLSAKHECYWKGNYTGKYAFGVHTFTVWIPSSSFPTFFAYNINLTLKLLALSDFCCDFRLLTLNWKKSPTDPVDTEVVATGADGATVVATEVVVLRVEKTVEHQDNTCDLTVVDSKAMDTAKVRTNLFLQ